MTSNGVKNTVTIVKVRFQQQKYKPVHHIIISTQHPSISSELPVFQHHVGRIGQARNNLVAGGKIGSLFKQLKRD